ncbi:MAG: CZB domain-containing protein [Rhodocyclales bacterium]|nr:CZB domain-containing protein [Rhodocyclales bacterium]
MSILSWLKGALTGEANTKLEFVGEEQHFGGLDMKAALEAHAAWKTRLEAQIRGDAGETLSVATVAADGNCALGKWIHGEAAQRFGDYPEFAQLRKVHADFHLCAGGILSQVHDGDMVAAGEALKRDLRHHSDAVQLALVRLYAKDMERRG